MGKFNPKKKIYRKLPTPSREIFRKRTNNTIKKEYIVGNLVYYYPLNEFDTYMISGYYLEVSLIEYYTGKSYQASVSYGSFASLISPAKKFKPKTFDKFKISEEISNRCLNQYLTKYNVQLIDEFRQLILNQMELNNENNREKNLQVS